jgi:adenylate/nucleoside-diphosphate kinase
MKSIDHLYDWDAELELANKAIGVVKEHIGEDLVREIDATGTDEEVLVKLLKELDPFVLQCDNPEDVRVTADLGEEDRKLPKGDFGDYCPVTYVDESFLVKGNPEFEHTVHGKTYLFAGEKEHETFKKDPSKYLIVQQGKAKLPLQPPNPKIMIMGMKGSGISTQIRMICEKYRLDEFVLKDEYLDRLKSEKDLRKRQRLLERGFKPLPPKEDEEENDPVDPEIEEDPEDFNKEEHEVTLMKDIFEASKGLIIDGTWTTLPEDVVGQPLQELLDQSRRYPEVVLMLKCSEESTFTRMIDFDSIRAEYERLEEERIEKRKQERDEARKAKQEELKESLGEPNEDKTQEEIDQEYNEGMEKWEEEQDEEDATWKEEDPEKPVYEEMLDKFKEQLREQREKDEGFLEEFGTALKEKGVRVIDDLEADVSADFVQIKLLDKIKDHFLYRTDMIEKE